MKKVIKLTVGAAFFLLVASTNADEKKADNAKLAVGIWEVIKTHDGGPPKGGVVEFTKDGYFVKQLSVDPAQGGSFGMAVKSINDQAIFAAVDDNTATLIIWMLNL